MSLASMSLYFTPCLWILIGIRQMVHNYFQHCFDALYFKSPLALNLFLFSFFFILLSSPSSLPVHPLLFGPIQYLRPDWQRVLPAEENSLNTGVICRRGFVKIAVWPSRPRGFPSALDRNKTPMHSWHSQLRLLLVAFPEFWWWDYSFLVFLATV